MVRSAATKYHCIVVSAAAAVQFSPSLFVFYGIGGGRHPASAATDQARYVHGAGCFARLRDGAQAAQACGLAAPTPGWRGPGPSLGAGEAFRRAAPAASASRRRARPLLRARPGGERDPCKSQARGGQPIRRRSGQVWPRQGQPMRCARLGHGRCGPSMLRGRGPASSVSDADACSAGACSERHMQPQIRLQRSIAICKVKGNALMLTEESRICF